MKKRLSYGVITEAANRLGMKKQLVNYYVHVNPRPDVVALVAELEREARAAKKRREESRRKTRRELLKGKAA